MGKTRSARGAVEEPGRNVKTKAGLNREILATGRYGLKAKLADKCTVEGVDPAYMTLTCNADRKIMTPGIGHSARRGAFALATTVTRDIDQKLKA